MKKIILITFLFLSIKSIAQDISQIVVNLSDNPKLQWNGAAVKQKAIVTDWRPLINGNKEFYIAVRIQYYENISGAYGSRILDLIAADQALQTPTLSTDQASQLRNIYADRSFDHQSTGLCCDSNGVIVNCSSGSSIGSEAFYWQQFKLNQVSGITSISTQGAFDAEYKIIAAIVAKMNTRKNW